MKRDPSCSFSCSSVNHLLCCIKDSKSVPFHDIIMAAVVDCCRRLFQTWLILSTAKLILLLLLCILSSSFLLLLFFFFSSSSSFCLLSSSSSYSLSFFYSFSSPFYFPPRSSLDLGRPITAIEISNDRLCCSMQCTFHVSSTGEKLKEQDSQTADEVHGVDDCRSAQQPVGK